MANQYTRTTPPQDRFWSKVEKRDIESCWEWLGGKNPQNGYGIFHPTKHETVTAHRFAFQLSKGEIPPRMVVCHRCDNRSCVNPNHLFLGTMRDNLRDMVSKGRAHNGISRGSHNGNSKLTENDVIEIRRLYSEGLFQRELAEMFAVDHSHIGLIVNGKLWKHI